MQKKIDSELEFLLPLEYLADATREISRAKNRVFLIGLKIIDSALTHQFIKECQKAAKRGVEVHIAADFMTYNNNDHRLDNSRNFLPLNAVAIQKSRELEKKFRASGVQFRWLGREYSAFFLGRTHSKWLVVDNVAYSFGGVNTEKKAFLEFADYMLKFRDQKIADALVKEHLKIEQQDCKKSAARNHRVATKFGEILFDGGNVGRSLIYNETVKLAKTAQKITFVSQYAPTGRLAKILEQKNAAIYFNRLENVASASNRMMIRLSKNRLRAKNLYQRKRYLHAKFILFEMSDGAKFAISGSHNFVAASSRLGTREVALLTDNQEIIAHLEKFFREEIA